MPLILISGYPSSGKTTRTRQLIDSFTSRLATRDPSLQRLRIIHISDTTLSLPRTVYGSARAEKDARAAFSSAIKRHLARDVLLIADGMNYIKGFRYQLYCEAKAIPTPSCVVHVGTPIEQCREWNDAALAKAAAADPASSASTTTSTEDLGGGGGYPPEIFENLVYRYEEPNGMTRWDSPLFTVAAGDAEPPCDAIWAAMVGETKAPSATSASMAGGEERRVRVRPNAATVLKPAAEQGYLYEVDRVTSDVVARITAWGKDNAGEGTMGGEVRVDEGGGGEDVVEDGGREEGLVVHLPIEMPSLSRLQALRRQFITLNRQHTLGKARIRGMFVDYLNDAFQA